MNLKEKIEAKFSKLVQEGADTLARSGWNGREYARTFPPDDEYVRFRTESLNLISQVAGKESEHYSELRRLAESKESARNPYYFHQVQGVLLAAHRDFTDDFLFDVRRLVSAEVLADLMEQADTLLAGGFYIPAASLAGAILEDFLRRVSAKNKIAVPGKTTIDRLNADLAKAGVYDKLVQKRITALADIRNNADHGHFDKFRKDDVEDMVKYTRRFAADYL